MQSHMHFIKKFLRNFKTNIKNNGDNLTITFSGEPEKIEQLERKINAIKELCCCCCEDEDESCKC